MKVIVVHEDGDRSDRVEELYDDIAYAVRNGTMRYQGVTVSIHVMVMGTTTERRR